MSFLNQNVCASFSQTIPSTIVPLSSQSCSEVILWNRTGTNILVYDNDKPLDTFAFLLSAGEQFTFRGVTNSNQLSAKTQTGTGTIYFRTQFFSQNILR
jgi:hypothetical protein